MVQVEKASMVSNLKMKISRLNILKEDIWQWQIQEQIQMAHNSL